MKISPVTQPLSRFPIDTSEEKQIAGRVFSFPKTSSYQERVQDTFELYKDSLGPYLALAYSLLINLFIPSEGQVSGDDLLTYKELANIRTLLGSVRILETQAEQFSDRKTTGEIARALKNARLLTEKALQGTLQRNDLARELQEQSSPTLILGYKEEEDFHPLILTIKKRGNHFLVESFALQEPQDKELSLSGSWLFTDQESLLDCLETAVALTKQSEPIPFSLTEFLYRQFLPKHATQSAFPPFSEEPSLVRSPSSVLVSTFQNTGTRIREGAVPGSVSSKQKVLKSWIKNLLPDPRDEILFRCNLRLQTIILLGKELENPHLSVKTRKRYFRSLQQELLLLKNQAKKDSFPEEILSAIANESARFENASEILFTRSSEEIIKPLTLRPLPALLVSDAEKTDSNNQNVHLEVERLRSLRASLDKTTFFPTLREYVATITKLKTTGSQEQISDAILSFFDLLPEHSDVFWSKLPVSELPETARCLSSLSEELLFAEFGFREGLPSDIATSRLFLLHQILCYLAHRYTAPLRDRAEHLLCEGIEKKSDVELERFYVQEHGTQSRSSLSENSSSDLAKNRVFSSEKKRKFYNWIRDRLSHNALRHSFPFYRDFSPEEYIALFSLPVASRPVTSLPVSDRKTSPLSEGYSYQGKWSSNYDNIQNIYTVLESLPKQFEGKKFSLPPLFESVYKNFICLQMAKSGSIESSRPISEQDIREAKQEIVTGGYRTQNIDKLAKRCACVKSFRKSLSSDTKIVFSYGDPKPIKIGNFFFKRSSYWEDRENIQFSEHAQLAKFGLHGKIPADLLLSSFQEESLCYHTPASIIEMESTDPSLHTLSEKTLIALHLLNPCEGLPAALRFLREHFEDLEHEEVRRRFEYVVSKSGHSKYDTPIFFQLRKDYEKGIFDKKYGKTGQDVNIAYQIFRELLTKAKKEKRYKTESFLRSITGIWDEEALAFYRDRLETKSLADRKYFALDALSLLQNASRIWTEEEWILALKCQGACASSGVDTGRPDLQSELTRRMKEQFALELENRKDRDQILSSFLDKKGDPVSWERVGDNYKIVGKPIYFMTFASGLLRNNARSFLPASVAFQPMFRKVCGEKTPFVTAHIEGNGIRYRFPPFSVLQQGSHLRIFRTIGNRDYEWHPFPDTQETKAFSALESVGIWIDIADSRSGKCLIGERTLTLRCSKQSGKIKIDRIENEAGHRLVLPKEFPAFFDFLEEKSPLFFADENNRLQEILSEETGETVQRTKEDHFLFGKTEICPSRELQRRARKEFTPNLSEYGCLVTDTTGEEEKLRLKLFFSKDRNTQRPLSVRLEKTTFPEDGLKIEGSFASFLFLSLQAAREGLLEKAVMFLSKAAKAEHPSSEDIDCEWFTAALEQFPTHSLAMKLWKLKCRILLLREGEKKLGKPIFSGKDPVSSLRVPTETVRLYNEITLTLSTSGKQARKERRLSGGLLLTDAEVRFLHDLRQKALIFFEERNTKGKETSVSDSDIEQLLKDSPLSKTEKQRWTALLKESQHPNTLSEFLEECLQKKINLLSERITTQIENDLLHLTPKKKEKLPLLSLPPIKEAFDLSVHFRFVLPKSRPVPESLFSDTPEERNLLVKASEHIAKTPEPEVIRQEAFEIQCRKTEREIRNRLSPLIADIVADLPNPEEFPESVVFDTCVDRFIEESLPEKDRKIAEAIQLLIALQALQTRSYEALSQAFNPDRLSEISSGAVQRAILVSELRSGHVSRPFQPGIIEKLVKEDNLVILCPPGSGKSTAILPAAARAIARETGDFPVIILTEELFASGAAGFDVTTEKLFGLAGHIFSFDRNGPKDPLSLASEVERIARAKAAGEYVVTTAGKLASLRNEIILQISGMAGASEEEKGAFAERIRRLKQLYALFRGKDVRFLIDELDAIFLPNIDYNYAEGAANPIEDTIREAVHGVFSVIFTSKDPVLQEVAQVIVSGNQGVYFSDPESKRLQTFLQKLSEEVGRNEDPMIQHVIKKTLPSLLTLSPCSAYAPSDSHPDKVVVSPRLHGLDLPGTRYSDPAELATVHYLYYAGKTIPEEYLNMFFEENERDLFIFNKQPEVWGKFASMYQQENLEERAPEERAAKFCSYMERASWKQRFFLVEHLLKTKVKQYELQIRSNVYEVFRGCRVTGLSGTMKKETLSTSFKTNDPSVSDRNVPAKTIGLINPEEKISLIDDGIAFLRRQAADRSITGIIDQRGLQKEQNSLEIARILLEAGNRQILFIHPRDRKPQMWNPGQKQPVPFIPSERKNDCLCYFGEADCRGTDWKLPDGNFSFIVGPDCTFDDFLQAFWRARRAGKGQTVRFFAERELVREGTTVIDFLNTVIRESERKKAVLKEKTTQREAETEKRDPLYRIFDPLMTEKTAVQLFSDNRSKFIRKREEDRFSEAGKLAVVQEQQAVREQVQEQVFDKEEERVHGFGFSSKSYDMGHDRIGFCNNLLSVPGRLLERRPDLFPSLRKKAGFSCCFAAPSALKHMHLLIDRTGLQQEHSLLWYAMKDQQNHWKFLLVDAHYRENYPLTQNKPTPLLLEIRRDGFSGPDIANRFHTKYNTDLPFLQEEDLPFSFRQQSLGSGSISETLGGSTVVHYPAGKEEYAALKAAVEEEGFWEAFAQAKILSGCWSFRRKEEIEGLQRFLRSRSNREEVEEIAIVQKLGKRGKKEDPLWKSSDLYRIVWDRK